MDPLRGNNVIVREFLGWCLAMQFSRGEPTASYLLCAMALALSLMK